MTNNDTNKKTTVMKDRKVILTSDVNSGHETFHAASRPA